MTPKPLQNGIIAKLNIRSHYTLPSQLAMGKNST